MAEMFTNQDKSDLRAPEIGSALTRTDSMEWQSSGTEGFLIKPLIEDQAKGIRTWLMKVEPGTYADLHAHSEIEQIYILQGAFYDQDRTYHTGDYIVRAAGAMHSSGSEDGAVVLLMYSPA